MLSPAPRRNSRQRVAPPRRFETLEGRVVMSADPLLGLGGVTPPPLTMHGLVPPPLVQHGLDPPLVHHDLGPSIGRAFVEPDTMRDPNADFWLTSEVTHVAEEDLGHRIEQTLADAHQATGHDEVVSTYGFDGAGQTVAVIDSGIAYTHTALGGGLGPGYRVVGGWDFTENDADFYDDGPEGGHGSHVAGIVGAAGSGAHSGVATGVDLVGLRVFDDAGNGYFSRVESALRWVRDNRLAFENPITAVNLSLGAEANTTSIPAWAMLEDEFADLEAAGVFISVSAGNSFASYNETGLAYPASSSHVIPVMSSNNGGGLSHFSQRVEHAIAAPGRWITSTVPDYAANDSDSIDDDWISMSGTSMAAPYVAGASVLVREAMEFVGQTGIDQWDIYNHMMATADDFHDSATDTWYKRLNLEAAIDALMPTDDFGSSVTDAYDLGTVNATPQASAQSIMSGAITTLTDDDYFTFTAGASGTVTATASGVTHNLVVDWWGSGWTEQSAGVYTMDVVGGQSYTFAIGTDDGLGYYDLALDLEATFTPVDLGAMADTQDTRTGLAVAGDQWFAVTAHQAGYFTAQALANSGSATVAIYDAQQNLLAADSAGRADASVAAGESLLLRVSGASSDFDLRMTNAVAVIGNAATVTGTSNADVFAFTAGLTQHSVSLNGVSYSIDAAVNNFALTGGGGQDGVTMRGSTGDDLVDADGASTTLSSSGFVVESSGFANTVVQGNGGFDTATLRDSVGVDDFRGDSTSSFMRGSGFFNRVTGFDLVNAISNRGGADRAVLVDSVADDTVTLRADNAELVDAGATYRVNASGFASVSARSTAGGSDTAIFHDSAADDTLVSRADFVVMWNLGLGYNNYAEGFASVTAYATAGGVDRAALYDSAGDDLFTSGPDLATFVGLNGEMQRAVHGFERVEARSASGGTDRAVMNDSAGNDRFIARPNFAVMWDDVASYWVYSEGFEQVESNATAGSDHATLYDSAGDDTLTASPRQATITDSTGSYQNTVDGYAVFTGHATSGGNDQAQLYDSASNDTVISRSEFTLVQDASNSFSNYVSGFDAVDAHATAGGADRVSFFDSVADDTFTSVMGYASIVGATARSATGFDRVEARAGAGGVDRAVISDSVGNDTYVGRSSFALIYSADSSYWAYAEGFAEYNATSSSGSDSVRLFDSSQDDTLTAAGDSATLGLDAATHQVSGFDSVRATRSVGSDTSSVSAIDFALELLGGWL